MTGTSSPPVAAAGCGIAAGTSVAAAGASAAAGADGTSVDCCKGAAAGAGVVAAGASVAAAGASAAAGAGGTSVDCCKGAAAGAGVVAAGWSAGSSGFAVTAGDAVVPGSVDGSGFANATTGCSAAACGLTAGAGVADSDGASVGVGAGCTVPPDAGGATAGREAMASRFTPNFGSADALPVESARITAVEARNRSMRTPGIANSPSESALGRSQNPHLDWRMILATASLPGNRSPNIRGTLGQTTRLVAAQPRKNGPIHAIFRGCRSPATASPSASPAPEFTPSASNLR